MYLDSLYFSEEEAREFENANNSMHFICNLNFLRCHRGIRPNKMHLLLSPTHGGKSTAVRAALLDVLRNNRDKKILIWLSEETIKEFKTEFSKTFPSHDILKNVAIISEQNGTPTADEVRKNINEAIQIVEPDLIFIDNITTSQVYKKHEDQENTAIWLKRMCKEAALFVIAHTNTSDFHNRFLNEQDIRGSKTIVNLCEFLYILQPITVGNRLFQFIHIKKNRGQKVKDRFFRLFYNGELEVFDKDMAIDFDEIKRHFKQRNQL